MFFEYMFYSMKNALILMVKKYERIIWIYFKEIISIKNIDRLFKNQYHQKYEYIICFY